MPALATPLRKQLERAIQQARVVAEQGARKALDALAVGRHEPHGSMSTDERSLRNQLRAHGRQLGDARDSTKGTQSIRRLEREVAYEHWHRMLFARFLAENSLLIEPESQVAVSLEECEELAREEGSDPWALAASYAERMLPQIFRPDDPALAVTLPPETRQALQKLLADLEPSVFTADDALGWTYQFWQSAEKDAVNARVKSGEKITGETLPAVTQLFTEPYMVQFLLHNTLGAWHAGKQLAAQRESTTSASSEQSLRDAVALDDYAFEYLRFVHEPREGEADSSPGGTWRPAAGTYPGWPAQARDLKVLDPCCGSGHFLVAAFDLMVRLRRAEEGLALDEAIAAVLSENLFGLELDARCTQIAAFHLALAAWRMAGRHIELPALNIACSGLGPNASKEAWLVLAEQAAANAGMPSKRDLFGKEESLLSDVLRRGLERLHESFQLAPELGSLINPAAQSAAPLHEAGIERLQPLFDAVMAAESVSDELHERAVAAQGIAKAARVLAGPQDGYTLVLTNVPYLGRGSQSELLKEYADKHFKEAKADLATLFVSRMLGWVGKGKDAKPSGTIAAVMPQNWLFLKRSSALRRTLLSRTQWDVLAQLGPGAFETISGEVVKPILLVITNTPPRSSRATSVIDLSAIESAHLKSFSLKRDSLRLLPQSVQLGNPDHRITFQKLSDFELLSVRANGWQGIAPSDTPRFVRRYWELSRIGDGWALQQSRPAITREYGGRELVLFWENGHGAVTEVCQDGATFRGEQAWGHRGISIAQIGLASTLYTGELFDGNAHALVPFNESDVSAVWCYCKSQSYREDIRRIDRKLSVTNSNMVKVPFDLTHWKEIAAEKYPNGLPEPQSDDPTQWLFHGHPAHAEPQTALQVAVARLVGYRWPAELDEDMRLAPEARALVRRCSELGEHTDEDGIVCLSSVQGEGSAADRVRSLLAQAFGNHWTAAKEHDLLRAAGEHFHRGKLKPSLEDWLRDRLFEEHCALFHKRPFVWHVWDGLPDGFHALVNAHRLAGLGGEGRRTLEKLTSTYLGEWIVRQRQLSAAGEEGADGRLAAALGLQAELRKILVGEPPYDIFVRWKPLHEQPLGWDPDINDGVRLNIRPFLMARDVRAKNAGILRAKPDNTWCNAKKPGVKDRGKEPESLRPRQHFPWFWSCDPERQREHRVDFGAGVEGCSPAGNTFDGARWNGLHYSLAAKQTARAQHEHRA